jgi:glycosyltransferase involved in cell wall biosynthesis
MNKLYPIINHRSAPAKQAQRILLFSDAAPERNGAGAYYWDLSFHLNERGQRAELICPGIAGSRWDGRIRLPLPGDKTQRVVFPPASQIIRFARRQPPDVIIVATPGPYGLLGLNLARRLGVRLVVGFHTSFQRVTGLYWNRLFNAMTNWYFGTCDRLLFRRADLVVANSEEMANLARGLGAPAIRVIGTPLPEAFLSEPPPLHRDGPLEVVYAGRLAAEKNVHALLDAAVECPEIHFRIAGHGPLSHTIARHAERLSNLDALGWLSRERLGKVLDSADLLVLPSHVEAFGTVALEGMARARNVLVSGNCGILEWSKLRRGLFHIMEGEDVTSALRRIAELDIAFRQEKARIARRAALELHQETVHAWLSLLQVTDAQ